MERNSLRGPGYRVTNASMFKRVRLGGTRALEFRVEAVNLFNNVNLGNPNTEIGSPGKPAAQCRSHQLDGVRQRGSAAELPVRGEVPVLAGAVLPCVVGGARQHRHHARGTCAGASRGPRAIPHRPQYNPGVRCCRCVRRAPLPRASPGILTIPAPPTGVDHPGPRPWFATASVCSKPNELDEAYARFTEAVARNPSLATAHYFLGFVLEASARPRGSGEGIRAGSRDRPEDGGGPRSARLRARPSRAIPTRLSRDSSTPCR